MARIRTVKPELLRHVELFEAERETGLPLRIAFVGMLTAADRKGRFKWNPRTLKLDCLPYDEVDFSRVLDALWSRGWLVRYRQTTETGSHEYGLIPTFAKHQHINGREQKSTLPALGDVCVETIEWQQEPDASVTRQPPVPDTPSTRHLHVVDVTPGEGKGTRVEAVYREVHNSDSQYGKSGRTQPLVIEKIATASLRAANSLDPIKARNGSVSVLVPETVDAFNVDESHMGSTPDTETLQ